MLEFLSHHVQCTCSSSLSAFLSFTMACVQLANECEGPPASTSWVMCSGYHGGRLANSSHRPAVSPAFWGVCSDHLSLC
jgi:hypothetical protein